MKFWPLGSLGENLIFSSPFGWMILNPLFMFTLSFPKPFRNGMNYDSTSNIWVVKKFYNPGDNSFNPTLPGRFWYLHSLGGGGGRKCPTRYFLCSLSYFNQFGIGNNVQKWFKMWKNCNFSVMTSYNNNSLIFMLNRSCLGMLQIICVKIFLNVL